jgi:hypothetical protein
MALQMSTVVKLTVTQENNHDGGAYSHAQKLLSSASKSSWQHVLLCAVTTV